ncbi:MAG: YdcF family protein [Lactococcus plantarum]|nr:YdcF family protein [Lactococcus plantarum]MDN6084243.1 YdcF family protein [Lactococcus plantarum]
MSIIPDLIFLLILIIYLVITVKKKQPVDLKVLVIWLGLSLLLDTGISISKYQPREIIITSFIVLVGCWLLSYLIIRKDKRRLLAGYVCNVSLVMTVGYIGLLTFTLKTLTPVIFSIAIILIGLLFLIFGGYALIIFFFWNARIVLKKESRTLGNMLTLLLGIASVCLILVQHFLIQENKVLAYLYSILVALLIYFFFTFLTMLTSSILFNVIKPKLDKDYLIILGAGLLDGEHVTPLLAGRIDAGIAFYHKQLLKTGKRAILVMSGGQGGDEKIPEAVAMSNYALTKGVSTADIVLEDKSKTTLENLKFSKKILDDRSQGERYQSAFVSNDYHIFRAGVFARLVGLNSDGIGSRTARYFLPNAFIREYIAMILMYKKRHIVACLGLIIIAILLIIVDLNFVIK